MAEPFVVDAVAPDRLSMSFIRAAESCLRRAHHERSMDTGSDMATLGRLVHEALAAIGFACVMRDERQPGVLESVAIAERTLAQPEDEDPLSKAIYDEVLDMVQRWAQRGPWFRPNELIEVGSRLDFRGQTLSARIDRLAIEGSVAYVRDYKTGWADPADATPVQGEVYSWHVMVRHPDVDRVVYVEEHTRHGLESDPPHIIDRGDLPRIENFLATSIARLERAYAEGGELPATPGSACSSPTRCPVAGSCPKASLEPATWIATDEQAEATFEALLVDEARQEERRHALKGYLAREDRRALQVRGEEIGWSPSPGSEFDSKRLQADLAAKDAGVDLRQYRKQRAPSFGRRKAK